MLKKCCLKLLLLGLFSVAQSFGAPATVGTFTGGDPGEGLDMQGTFLYAVNVGPTGGGGKVGDAIFTSDNVPGVTIDANNSIGNGGWGAVNYGQDTDGDGIPDLSTDNDRNLSFVMDSIRWAAAPSVVTVTLRIAKGTEYKLQILEHEECCDGRGFNIVIDGVTEVPNLRPGHLQQGDTYPSDPNFAGGDFAGTKNKVGVVVTKQFVATSDTLVFVCDGPSADDATITDHNAILNGFTLERISAPVDSDNDGLPDDWEQKNFGNLDQKGTDDPDKDGLTNAEELAAGTNPNSADSDGDGLNDGDEIHTYKTNPLAVDTDGDTLSDGKEVNITHSDPTKIDSDGDGASDLEEFIVGTDPMDKDSKPLLTTVGVIKGGDAGEGLDLQGNFVYALAIGAGDDANVQVGDALFQPLNVDEVPGATLSAANDAAHWYNVVYGDTPDDQNLALATSSIRYQGPVVSLQLDNLEVGAEYKVQLMFGEACCNRGFGVYFDDQLVAKEFNPGIIQGGIGNNKQEALLTHTFFAQNTSTTIKLDVRAASFPDPNPILNAVTVERVSGPVDSDADGLPDEWEKLYFGNLSQTGSGDPDGDGLTNAQEYAFGSDPTKADADKDGLNDSAEKTAGTNPNLPDSDGDGLSDGAELSTYHTDPLKKDTDGDGLSDSAEVLTYKTDPNNKDTDNDGVSDGAEVALGTDPLVSNRPRLTTIGLVQGGDPGEGLDLDGNFVYALAIGAPDGTDVKVRDAEFLTLSVDEVPGANLVSGHRIQTPGWYNVDYGDSDNDNNLEIATSSICWSDYTSGTPAVILTLDNLEPGAEYKVQVVGGEACCDRSYNVFFDDVAVLRDFNPGKVQGGINQGHQAAVVTQLYFAKSTQMVLRLDGRGAGNGGDHNAILNAVTVEKLAAPADTDHDGLPDEWEKFYFGNLAQTADGDPDGDGLTNAQEFALGSDPGVAEPKRDTDGDGLSDADEAKLYHTDPAKADTDGDGLSDGDEVTKYLTNPLKADTDGDGADDGQEVLVGTDPTVAEPKTLFSNITIGSFTGGDPGEGLDLQGNFIYAVNVSSAGPAGQAGDANFTGDNVPGVKVTAPSNVAVWDTPEYGDTPADDAMELVTGSIRYGPRMSVALSNLVPGGSYRLQMFFYEQCCGNRGFNVWVDGVLVGENFNPSVVQGGVANTSAGAVISADFTTQRDHAIIVLTTTGLTDPSLTDPNAILDGFTLELLGGGPPPAFHVTKTVLDANAFSVTFESQANATYTLEYKLNLTDAAWQTVGTVQATGASTVISDNAPSHIHAAHGFWRVKR